VKWGAPAIASALLAVSAAAAAAATPAADPARGARQWAAAFEGICLRSGFDRARAEAAFKALGWKGVVLQRGGGETAFTYWEFPFGELWFGSSKIAGIDLKTFSCTLSIKAPGAPPRAELEAALEARLAPAHFEDARERLGTFTRVARIKDREDEQEAVTLVGNRIAMHVPQGFELRRGLFIDYSYTKGAHAKELKGR
jgi:hypothetical protein